MIRKFQMFMPALIAAFALSALMASVAGAQFTSDKEHTVFSGSQLEAYKYNPGPGFATISCTTVSFSGTAVSKSETTLTFAPTFSSCKDSLGRILHVTTKGYTYTFTSGAGKGTMHVNGEIVITTTGSGTHCTLTMKAQANNGISYVNLGGTKGFELKTATTNVHTTASGGFFACGSMSTTLTGGTRAGRMLITGKDTGGNAATISVD